MKKLLLTLVTLLTISVNADQYLPDTFSNKTGVATADSTTTFTNKTIDADGTGNSISNIENADIKSGAAIDATKIHDGSVDNTEFGYVNGVTSAIQTQLGNKAASGANSDITSTTGLTSISNAADVTIQSTGAGVNINTHTDTGDDFAVNTDKFIVKGDTGCAQTSQCFGVGAAPSDWDTTFKSVEFSGSGSISDDGSYIYSAFNAYYDDTDNRWEFTGTGRATLIKSGQGRHYYYVSSASGSAGGAVTWTEAITVYNDALVGLPTTYNHDMNGETIRDLQINNIGELGYDSGSRMELKTNVNRIIDSSIIYSKEFEPFSFQYKGKKIENGKKVYSDDVDPSPIVEYGFDVREIAKKLPARTNIVYIDKEGEPQGINYKKMVPILIDAIRKLELRVKALENK